MYVNQYVVVVGFKKSHESRWQTRFTCKLLNGLILYVKQNDNCRNLNNHGVDRNVQTSNRTKISPSPA